uniref:BZIP domain-containing protein n=1 Tax=Steinernema glaseri TaxID=37863 RepID=A0A1I7ZXX7_9BILA
MNDAEVEMDESTSEAEKMRIIYKRKYARNYRQKLRADILQQEELKQMLAQVQAENRQLKETLDGLRREHQEIITNFIQSAGLLQFGFANTLRGPSSS